MEIENAIEQQVAVRFTITEADLSYTDALYFTPEEYAALDAQAVEDMQRARFENWKAMLTAPPHEPTEADKQATLESLLQQQKLLSAQIAALGG